MVSVIMIFLNAERFIEEAIESVLAQSYDHWELLLVDDGSSDTGTEIARRYVTQHPGRIRYLQHPGHENRGMSAARNLGIAHARGEYVAFLDADDVWLSCKLEHQVALIEAHPEAGLLCGASQYWYGWTGRAADARRDRIVPVGAPQDTLHRPPALLTLLHPLGRGAAPCVSSLLLRRRVIVAVNGFEESFRGIYQLYEDQAFLTKVYLETPVFVSGRCHDRYRQHDASCVVNVTGAGQRDVVRGHFLSWFARCLSARGTEDIEVWSALNRALRPYRRPILFLPVTLARRLAGALRNLRSTVPSGGGA
jgi:glycosyltransferase involved in cell wall biosynthesis